MKTFQGFIVSFIIVLILFVFAAFASGTIAGYIGLWKKPIIGAFSAFVVVFVGYKTAPKYKNYAAALWLLAGGIAAYFLSGDSYYPEDHQHAYQLTYIPLIATYVSGIFALIFCFWLSQKQR
jgi:hypothetical protein